MISPSALANNGAIVHAQTQNWAYHNCGSPNPAHCVGTGGNTGGGYYKEPKGKPTYVWVAIHSTNPQTSNMPMFYSLKVYLQGVNSLAERYFERLKIYGLQQCEKQYGAGTCSVMNGAYGPRSSYVALDRVQTGGGYNYGVTWSHDGKAKAKQDALQGCQSDARQKGYNPNDCQVIDNRSFASVGNQIPDNKKHILYSDEIVQDPRLPCSVLIEADRPACEQRRQNR